MMPGWGRSIGRTVGGWRTQMRFDAPDYFLSPEPHHESKGKVKEGNGVAYAHAQIDFHFCGNHE
jgi:hypothetical protein